jgi:hypothetical protein
MTAAVFIGLLLFHELAYLRIERRDLLFKLGLSLR